MRFLVVLLLFVSICFSIEGKYDLDNLDFNEITWLSTANLCDTINDNLYGTDIDSFYIDWDFRIEYFNFVNNDSVIMGYKDYNDNYDSGYVRGEIGHTYYQILDSVIKINTGYFNNDSIFMYLIKYGNNLKLLLGYLSVTDSFISNNLISIQTNGYSVSYYDYNFIADSLIKIYDLDSAQNNIYDSIHTRYRSLLIKEHYLQTSAIKLDENNNFSLSDFPLLISCFPNPFNPSTTISFNLPIGETADDLKIYSLNGKLVEHFKNLKQNRVVWKAKEQASGVYIVKIMARERIFAKKMVLIK